MKYIKLGNTEIEVPAVILGCMRMGDKPLEVVNEVIQNALDHGMNFFDHADIYGGGKGEEVFAQSIKALGVSRDALWIQSKAGIRPDLGMFDFSKEHILNSVDKSLERLNTGYLDSFLLHRPDTLMDLDEVAEAFNELYASGKVKHFGVSNFNAMQIEMLKKTVTQPLLMNQVQFGLMHTSMIDSGFNVNNYNEAAVDRDGAILEYSRLHDITLQAWSPFIYGYFEGIYIGNEKFPEVNAILDELALKYNVTNTAIATAWVLRHPASIQMIAGTMNPHRVLEIAEGANIVLTREEWYKLYKAAGNILP
ncbi:aldo/keto reductase [Erysipelothrix larvae]|uniref:Aldo/keto reductase n=1 Tax=Erysipelothrix larvae TaxID=1514105 RepID=A0A0X8H038_9FIRM|nr:aldo/keto reductase [Erysipelothrix larvae]AMC93612.1 aldo/keto reductase [Erysipelothrix larvae]